MKLFCPTTDHNYIYHSFINASCIIHGWMVQLRPQFRHQSRIQPILYDVFLIVLIKIISANRDVFSLATFYNHLSMIYIVYIDIIKCYLCFPEMSLFFLNRSHLYILFSIKICNDTLSWRKWHFLEKQVKYIVNIWFTNRLILA